MLYIVSTPIGNLKDMTYRAVDVLKSVDLIAAEDTRHTRILTKHYKIETPLTSYFEHNEKYKGARLLQLLKEDKNIALVSDAGTPGINDPGYRLINLARDNHIPVAVIPGACALIAALSLSGMPSDSFIFEGFLPVKSGARRKKLETWKEESRTIIFYESPYRIIKTLKDIETVFGNKDVLVTCARELTKKFEEIQKGTLKEVAAHFEHTKPKGEFVVLVKNTN